MAEPLPIEDDDPPRHATDNTRGALWMLGSAVTFTVMVTLIKFLGEGYPPTVQLFYRQAAGLIILAPWILRRPAAAFATHRPGILVFRSVVGTMGMILSFWAFQELPLADANALSFTRTLWLVPLAAFLLREKVGIHRIGAAIAGFAGVILMVQPGGVHGLTWPAVAMLAASFLFALTVTGLKTLTRDHAPSTLLYWSASLGFVLAIPPALVQWRWPSPTDLGLLAAMGAIATVNQACYIKGLQWGDAAAMAPMDYTRLIFAAAAGFLLFDEVPRPLTLAGALVVVASTLYITWREHRAVGKPSAS